MSAPAWAAWLAIHQDFFWALALFAWVAVALAGPRLRKELDLPWVLPAALAGLVVATLELSLLLTPVKPKPFIPSRLAWDAAISAVAFLLLLGWIWSAAKSPRQRGLSVAVILGVLCAAGSAAWDAQPRGWKIAHERTPEQVAAMLAEPGTRGVATVALDDVEGWRPWAIAKITAAAHAGGGWPLVLALTAAALVHARRLKQKDRTYQLALLCAVAAWWAASTGPLAEATHSFRASTQLSPWGPWSALLHTLAAGFILNGIVTTIRREEEVTPAEALQDLKQLAGLAGVWLAAGFVLAAAMGWLARRQFETGALGRVRAAALLIDRALLDRELETGLRTIELINLTDAITGRRLQEVSAPGLASGGLRPIETTLAVIAEANPDVFECSVATIRQGLIVLACEPSGKPGWRTLLGVHRAPTAADQAAWDHRAAFFNPPEFLQNSELAFAFSPLVADDGRMLGWLRFSFGATTWHAAQSQARIQAFATTGLGLLLITSFFELRREVRRRERARLAAVTAAAADRAKTAFLAKVSHELRTPIQSILGYGELIAQQPLAPDTRRWLESLRSHGQLLTRLVNDLIDLSSLQAGAFRLVCAPGDLAALIRSAVDSLRPRAVAKGLRLECSVAPEVEGGRSFDAERMRQLLLNLVGNAIKFTSRGAVTIEVSCPPADATAVELRIRDTGPGIAPEDQARLFQPFCRLDAAIGIEGAGLGLALTQGLCAAMNGRLTVESDGETGSTFIARLQLPVAVLPPREAEPERHSLAGRRVLVADDNTLVRELFLSCLRSHGAECDSVTDGLAAVERIIEETFDVLVLDISMPWLDGFEATRRLRRHGQTQLRIVGVSAHAGAAERSQALAAGMDVFLVKPVQMSALVDAISSGSSHGVRAPAAQMPTLDHLRALFAREAPQLRAEIQAAAGARDRDRLQARVHYLKNSADIARYDELSLRCAQLESILHAGGTDAERLVAEIDRDLCALSPSG